MGSLFIALAAMLWASDALVRYPLIHNGVSPIFIVYFDHLLVTVLLTPFLVYRFRAKLIAITKAQWIGLILLGAGASAVATVLFTASFKYVNPSVSILLQKLQPIFVVLMAFAFLGERPKKSFWFWAPLALLAGLTISFPKFQFHFLTEESVASTGSLYALSAAGLWAIATVVGKGVVGKLPPMVVTYWRFVFGLLTLAVMRAASGASITDFSPLENPEVVRSLLYVALVPGMLALILYYQGMARTTASKATFMELLFPVTAVTINTLFLDKPLEPIQAAAALVLLFAISQISIGNQGKR